MTRGSMDGIVIRKRDEQTGSGSFELTSAGSLMLAAGFSMAERMY